MSKKLVWLMGLAGMLAAAQSVSADLIGHWMLDGDGIDASGNALHGTVNGNVVPTADKLDKPDSAMLFGGASGDYISIGDPPALQLTGAMTLSAWVKLDSLNTNNARIFSKAGGGGARSWSLNIEASSGGIANPPTFQISPTGAANISISGPESLPADQWVHMAGVYIPGEATELYVDGELKIRNTTGIPASQFSNNNRTILIGNRNNCSNCGWLGAIDDVRIYDHALTQQELISAMKGEPQPYAFRPDPPDGALHENTWAYLSWASGDMAVSHDVYVGESFDDVNAGTGETFRGNQATTTLLIGLPGGLYPDGLIPGTTYYWRIDEVNTAEPNSPWKGTVWSFSIPPRTAYNPDPADGAGSVALNAKLSWTAGYGAKLHTVYVGDSFDDVNSASTGGAVVGATTYSPSLLESAKVYYWRVDESDPPTMYKGQVWSFTTVGAVGNPYPANGAPSVEMNAILTWMPGDDAASHQVYFGTEKEAVRKAAASSPEYKGTRALGVESYDPGLLAWDSTFYWRIDEVNSTNPASPWKGPVWSFTANGSLILDGFESYNDIDPPDPASHRIFETWLDGYGTTTNGALVGNEFPPYAERTIVHGDAQSMPYRYDNNLKFSEATMTLSGAARDWTRQGVAELSLWFRGAAANAAERMYVALNGTAVVYNDDTTLTQKTAWTRWIIPLQQFADKGVNLTNVTSVTIGFGTRGNTTAAGGTGQMYFDDIRLYR